MDIGRDPVPQLVDHLFRREYGRLVAGLLRVFGVNQIDLVEDVVQDALMSALTTWPFRGIPDQPTAWLRKVARNKALDRLRRETKLKEILEKRRIDVRDAINEAFGESHIDDQVLRMMFFCCHPSIPEESRAALTLKLVGGFDAKEIARAFLTTDSAVTRRLHRARTNLRENCGEDLELPGDGELERRLDSVLAVIYLMFNEGYSACAGEDLVRRDLVHEAIRLVSLLAEDPRFSRPRVWALLALLCLQGARIDARVSPVGDLVRLEDQDRSLWNPALVRAGFVALGKAGTGDGVSEYHLQAGIAACHAAPGETDWQTVLARYDQLLALTSSPVVALNRIVAISRVHGAERALEQLEPLADHGVLKHYYLCDAVYGELLLELDRSADAREAFQRAHDLAETLPERQFLATRIAACE